MVVDRRARRAQAPLLALEYFLDAERSRSGAGALGLFLGDELLVTSAPDENERTELESAFSERAAPSERDVYVLPMSKMGMTLVSTDARVRSFRAVEQGIVRILAG